MSETSTSTARRIARNAALDSAFLGQSYRITRAIRLSPSEPKFHAWISGARGRNGYEIQDITGALRIVGRTTLDEAHIRGAIENYDAFLASEAEADRITRLALLPVEPSSQVEVEIPASLLTKAEIAALQPAR